MELPKLVPARAEVLHSPTIPFDFDNPPMDPVELFQTLKEGLIKYRGLGLSANQIGIPYSVFVFGNPDDHPGISGVFNPKIVAEEGENMAEEGCLSYPGIILNVKRPFTIRVRYTTHNGVTDTAKFTNLTARIFHHEIDHLNGKTFGEAVSKLQLRMVLDKYNKKHHTNLVVGDFYGNEGILLNV